VPIDREASIRTALHQTLRRLSTGTTPLDLVEDIPLLESFIADYSDARIADARASGASWADIARRLGVSKQAVHKRFSAQRTRRRPTAVSELRFTRDKD
jgi:hypothetical protein